MNLFLLCKNHHHKWLDFCVGLFEKNVQQLSFFSSSERKTHLLSSFSVSCLCDMWIYIWELWYLCYQVLGNKGLQTKIPVKAKCLI